MDIIVCIFLIFFTALITSIITEHSVIQRIQYTEGITFFAGKCRLKKGYGIIEPVYNSSVPIKEKIESIFKN